MQQDWILALIGGGIIGIAVSLMLLLNGRVTGISGIINGAISSGSRDEFWRWAFILGLIVGGFFVKQWVPDHLISSIDFDFNRIAVAGLLVGFGTIMGSGCTSGHGVCGLSRFSKRSLFATISFMSAGVLAVTIFRLWGVLP